MAQLEFKCERCGKLLKVDAAPGSPMKCSHCQELVTVPNVQSPRPAPQVMGGVRPQPVAMAGAGATSPAAVSATPPEDDESAVEPASALAAMSVLMPWAVSVVFHIAFLLVMMFFTFLIVSAPASGDEPDQVGEKPQLPGAEGYDPNGSDTPGSNMVTDFRGYEPAGPGKDTKDFKNIASSVSDNSAGEVSPFSTLAIMKAGGRPGGGGGGDGTTVSPFSNGNGGGRGSRFFGNGPPKGSAIRKIVYVVDSSGSMFDTFPYVRAELKKSIGNLSPLQLYSVVFFSDGPPNELTIDGQVKLQYATKENIAKTVEWIDKQIATSHTGETDPRASLERAFKIAGGPPELVYLLTDGSFGLYDAETIQLLGKLNFAKQVHVNTIAFRERSGEEELEAISKQNAGKYTFISADKLGTDY